MKRVAGGRLEVITVAGGAVRAYSAVLSVSRAISRLMEMGIIHEITGRKRDRVFVFTPSTLAY